MTPPGADSAGPPPPGWQEPGAGPPPPSGHVDRGPLPTGWTPLAVHKPGAIPLRPLRLSDIFDAAFKIIRYNAQATVGAALLVSVLAIGVPIALGAALGFLEGIGDPTGESSSVWIQDLGALVMMVLMALLGSIGLVLVTGMVAQVCAGAAIGRTMSLTQAWRATAGSRWRLLSLTVTLAAAALALVVLYLLAWVLVVRSVGLPGILLWGVFTVPLFGVLMVVFWIRLYLLAVPALLIERLGVFAAIRRGASLTSGQFFRVLGIALVAWLVAQIGSSVLATPFSLISTVVATGIDDTGTALLVTTLGQALGLVLSLALITPFSACVTTLQYLDLRIRKEAYDVELLTRSMGEAV